MHTTPDSAAAPAQNVRFTDFGLSDEILRALADQSYVHPTPIQAQAIPVVLTGRDAMGAAQTGTGKTASFSLPIIQRLLPLASTSMSPARHPVRALILAPTRELAIQVAQNVASYSRYTSVRSNVVYGGVDMAAQSVELRKGVEIVIATPGRLLDHVEQKNINLGQTEILVMDEADRMLDMGFLPDLQRIVNLLPKQRQSLMFSATFSPEIKKLAASFLNDPVSIAVARNNATAETVTQKLYKVGEDHKAAALTFLLQSRSLKQVLVFSNTKLGASRTARQLERDGIKAASIHGDRTQNERLAALDAFKSGAVDVLVATDVAARGLDIAELPCVVNLDLPYNAEDYVHRIGRTGRAGASGDALSLFSDKDERALADIEKLINRKIERAELSGFEPDAWKPARTSTPRDGRTSSSRSTPRRQPAVDPWFFKPYEPSASSLPEKPELKTTRALKQKLAFLLGGQPG